MTEAELAKHIGVQPEAMSKLYRLVEVMSYPNLWETMGGWEEWDEEEYGPEVATLHSIAARAVDSGATIEVSANGVEVLWAENGRWISGERWAPYGG